MNKNYNDVTILLVEDDDIDAMSIERSIKKLKLLNRIERVKNGSEALNILENNDINKPYIVLLDLNMPVMGGLEFLKKVRENETLRDSIIFVLTTSSADEDRVAAYKENIAGYIVKSNSTEGFNNVINMLDCYWRVVALPD